ILSNHQAPSRDIALSLADMERFKHQVSGGWWKNDVGEYVRGGEKVRAFLHKNSQLQRRLGWVDMSQMVSDNSVGSVKPFSQRKQALTIWASALSALPNSDIPPMPLQADPSLVVEQHGLTLDLFPIDRSNIYLPNDGEDARVWLRCKHLVSQAKDICRSKSWIFFREEGQKNVLFVFNAQHDCRHCGCKLTGEIRIIQEREETRRTQKNLEHAPVERYLVNMHALHNAAAMREILPRHLWSPKPYLNNRMEKHAEYATHLRMTGPTKRAAAVAKSAETRARNKKAKEDLATVRVDK
ncbi:hypothetical protein PHLCEN_2v11153, partial [Hermanssonia centrifuga]